MSDSPVSRAFAGCTDVAPMQHIRPAVETLQEGQTVRVLIGKHAGKAAVVARTYPAGSTGLVRVKVAVDGGHEIADAHWYDIDARPAWSQSLYLPGTMVRVISGKYAGLVGKVLLPGDPVRCLFEIDGRSTGLTFEGKQLAPASAVPNAFAGCTDIQPMQYLVPADKIDSVLLAEGDLVEVTKGEHAGKRGVVAVAPRSAEPLERVGVRLSGVADIVHIYRYMLDRKIG